MDRASSRTMGQHAGNKGSPPRVHPHGLLGVDGGRQGSRVSGGSFGKRSCENDGGKVAFLKKNWELTAVAGPLECCGYFPLCASFTARVGLILKVALCLLYPHAFLSGYMTIWGLSWLVCRHIHLPKTILLILGYTTNSPRFEMLLFLTLAQYFSGVESM